MAGESSRFNYKFKPFLYLDNKRFIEHTLDEFIKHDSIIESYNFIITKEQEKINNVINTINEIFPNLLNKINILQISEKTPGPYQTLQSAILENTTINNINNIIICDIDHSVNITPIIDKLNIYKNIDAIIPVWNINYDEHKNWGKVILNNNKINRFCEKECVEKIPNQEVFGLIGCYYFKNINILPYDNKYINFSDFFNNNFLKINIEIANIKKAYFYGTPEMVEKTIKLRRTFETIFCDIDGVLIKHNNSSNNNLKDNILIGNCVNKLKNLREDNKKIILVTARPKKTEKEFKILLKQLDILYDDIVMDLNPGPRYLINDIKPSNPFVKQSLSYNIIRNSGIDNLELNESENYKIEIIKKFKGNSFCNTYLLKKDDMVFVRKYIVKTNKSLEHYERLKRQCDDLKRFLYYNSEIVPKILYEQDSFFDYYIDLEYLENYKQLDKYDTNVQKKVLCELINILSESIYCYKKRNSDTNFITDFFNTKIYPKLNQFEKECCIMNYLINNENIVINNKTYYGLRKVINILNIKNFDTEWVHPIHGDLTLENILYNDSTNDIKLIDMEGSRYVDSCYFDLGKIFQSIISKYDEWNDITNIIYNKNIDNLCCNNNYFDSNFEDVKYICINFSKITEVDDLKLIYKRGIFYMATYFIRFVQFRRQINEEHGIFAIIMATVWLNNILNL
jgi:thiamine kinase-like enzyme